MDRLNYILEESGESEQPMSLQDYEFCLDMIQGAMVSQQQSQAQCYESPNPVLDESIPQWQIEFDKWEHEFEERIARTSKLLEEFSATIDVNCLLEQDQELTIQHPSKLHDSDSLLVHDDIVVHSFGAKREENVPLSHVAINNVHHNTALKEDGNREEENELSGNGLDHDTVLSRSKKGVDKEAMKKKKRKKQGLMSEVFDIFKKADVNFPLLDLINCI